MLLCPSACPTGTKRSKKAVPRNVLGVIVACFFGPHMGARPEGSAPSSWRWEQVLGGDVMKGISGMFACCETQHVPARGQVRVEDRSILPRPSQREAIALASTHTAAT